MKPTLTYQALKEEASIFSAIESQLKNSELFGITDGKAVGTYLEHLKTQFTFSNGNSASGLDIPDLNTDIKVTSIKQPQSSCPFRSARQKSLVWGIILFYLYTIKSIIMKFEHVNSMEGIECLHTNSGGAT